MSTEDNNNNSQLMTAANVEYVPSEQVKSQINVAKDIQLLSGNVLNSDDSMLLASMFSSGYLKDIDKLAKAVTRCVFGKRLNIPVEIALTGLYIIDGKPGLEAKTIRNQLRSAGYKIVPKELTDRSCVLEWSFNGKKLGESSFDVNNAVSRGYVDPACLPTYPNHASHEVSRWSKRSNRYEKSMGCDCKDNWKKMPQEMLMARATTRGNDQWGGQAFNDQEVYDVSELNDSPFRVDTAPTDDTMAAIAAAKTPDELQDVINTLDAEQMMTFNDAIQSRMEELFNGIDN